MRVGALSRMLRDLSRAAMGRVNSGRGTMRLMVRGVARLIPRLILPAPGAAQSCAPVEAGEAPDHLY